MKSNNRGGLIVYNKIQYLGLIFIIPMIFFADDNIWILKISAAYFLYAVGSILLDIKALLVYPRRSRYELIKDDTDDEISKEIIQKLNFIIENQDKYLKREYS